MSCFWGIYSSYYTFFLSENMSPNAMKNAAIIRRSVSGPVLVLVISLGVGFGSVGGVGSVGGGVTVEAARVTVAHSYAVLAALSFADVSITWETSGNLIRPTTSPGFLSVFSSLYAEPKSASKNLTLWPAGRIYWFFHPEPACTHTISLEYFQKLVSTGGVDTHVVFPNRTRFGIFCSSLYATRMFGVLLSQLSNNPVIDSPTLTEPASKHWSQLFVAKAELVLQLTDLYSPSAEPRERNWGAMVAPGFGAALSSVGVGVSDSTTWGSAGGTGTSTVSANTEEEIAQDAMMESEISFRIWTNG